MRNFITLDVGGTSADVAIVEEGAPRTSLTEHVADFPIMMPVVGVSCIGAGGGSIAWLDSAGVLRVGPQSAGADPGPACYGKGQEKPTVTDAFLYCGLLNPDTFAGGRIALHPALAQQALASLAPEVFAAWRFDATTRIVRTSRLEIAGLQGQTALERGKKDAQNRRFRSEVKLVSPALCC